MTFNIHISTGDNSATPLLNADVELGWSKPGTPVGNAGRLIASGKTSLTGDISFSFKAKQTELQGGQFYVTARKGDAYFLQQDSYYGIEKYDSVVTAEVHVPSKATLRIVFKNFSPVSPDDVFQCTPYFSSYGSQPLGISMKNQNGQPANTFILANDGSFTRLELTGTTAGDQYTHFTILKKKNGIRTDLQDSIYIAKGQAGVYEIEF